MKLRTQLVEKPWGRTRLPPIFGDAQGRRIGEIWFETPAGTPVPLLVKYIFTSENLSIQVHPDDAQAQERGLAQGKSECWYILDAEPGARLALGLRRSVSREALRAAALDGSIEELVDWVPVAAGDFFYVPAGTVHAIGAGISLLEFQQNADVTYRLYDYGRPRELHLPDGIEVARTEPHPSRDHSAAGNRTILVDGPHFTLVKARTPDEIPAALTQRPRWVMPLQGQVESGSDRAGPGECLLIEADAPLAMDAQSLVLVGVAGSLDD